jgi:ribose transport system permease protein
MMNIIRRYGVLIVTVLLFAVFSAVSPSLFLSKGNLLTILTSQSTILILALAVTIPLRAGEFDLSIASIMGLSMLVGALLQVRAHQSLLVVIVVSIVIGAACGGFNALLVIGFGINGFIATLGMSTVLTGIGYAATNSEVIGPLTGDFLRMSQKTAGSIPLAVFYGWGLVIVLWVIFEFTPLGRFWLFAGGNTAAARLSGVRTKRVKSTSFILAGAMCGFAGVLLAGTNGAADPSISSSYLLPPFAAAFLGTAVIQEGRFNVWGTTIGVYLISIGSIGLQLIGASTWASQVFSGGILVVAVGLSRIGKLDARRVSKKEEKDQPVTSEVPVRPS